LLQGRFFLNRGTPEDYSRAVEYFRGAIRADPTFALARAELARAYVNLAQFALTPRSFAEAFQLARTAAEQTLAVEPRMAFNIAQLYACRGETEQAFAWLHRACEQKDSGLIHAKVDPYLVQLHEDPRWGILLHRLGLSGEAAERIGATYLSMAKQAP
jgi:Flp pilus assembly protein TadD